jgi:hypothetical protein
LIDPVLLVALSNAVAKMPVVVDAPSIDAAVVSLTVTAVLVLIKSIETLEFVVSNDVCIEVSKSDDIRLDCGTCVSTPVVDKL